jgi:limonene-1,2-epoxide hydrolase
MSEKSPGISRTTRLVLLGAGVASVAALVVAATGCSTGRKVDMVGGGRDALAESEAPGRAAMSGSPEKVDAALARFEALFADYRPEAVGSVARELYADDAYFNDGFVELTGAETIAAYFGRSAEGTAAIEVEIEEMTKTADGVYLRWVMTFTIHHRKMTFVAPGMSHLRFTPEGRIAYHRDYWDGSGALSEMIPFAGSLLRAIKGRM